MFVEPVFFKTAYQATASISISVGQVLRDEKGLKTDAPTDNNSPRLSLGSTA